jgi:hypothetical protein
VNPNLADSSRSKSSNRPATDTADNEMNARLYCSAIRSSTRNFREHKDFQVPEPSEDFVGGDLALVDKFHAPR